MALRKGNAFWTGWGSKTTVGHVRDRQGVPKKEVSTERYKGFRIYESADGWTVPELDRGSLFESKREVKRFIDWEVKHMARNPKRKRKTVNPGWFSRTKDRGKYVVLSGGIPVHSGELSKSEALLMAKEARRAGDRQVRMAKANPKRKRNARTWHTITARMVGKYLEGFGNVLAHDVGKKYYVQDGSYFVENDAQMAARLGKAVNPRTLVPAKLKMMPNGTIKVLVSPGAMAKMRVGNPSKSTKALLDSLGYSVLTHRKDAWGKKHRYMVTPHGSGPTNYFDSAADLKRYALRVARDRKLFA